MARAGAGWFVVASIGVAMAGCMGGGSTESAMTSDGDGEATAESSVDTGTVFQFAGSNRTISGALGISDVFPGDASNYIGNTPDPHRHPLPEVVTGVWTHIRAEVSYEPATLFPGFLQLSLEFDDGSSRGLQGSSNNIEGISIYEGIFKANSGAAWLEVRSSSYHTEDLEYDLYASWRGDATIVYPQDPVELSLTPGADLIVETVRFEEGRYSEPLSARFLLFDGADALLTRHEAKAGRSILSIPTEASQGRFVYVPAGGAPVRLSTTSTQEDETLRLLSFKYEDGPAVEILPGGAATWTYDLLTEVVSIGIYAEYADFYVQNGVEARFRIESPTGLLIDWRYGCSAPAVCAGFVSGARVGLTVDRLDDNIVLGEYQYQLDPGTSTIASAGTMVLTYVR